MREEELTVVVRSLLPIEYCDGLQKLGKCLVRTNAHLSSTVLTSGGVADLYRCDGRTRSMVGRQPTMIMQLIANISGVIPINSSLTCDGRSMRKVGVVGGMEVKSQVTSSAQLGENEASSPAYALSAVRCQLE
jgi:hypothetical protein